MELARSEVVVRVTVLVLEFVQSVSSVQGLERPVRAQKAQPSTNGPASFLESAFAILRFQLESSLGFVRETNLMQAQVTEMFCNRSRGQ
jgi:hypothetical protein